MLFSEFMSLQGDDGRPSDGEVVSLYLNHPTMKVTEIAKQAGRSLGDVYRVLQSHQISPNRLRADHRAVHEFVRSGLPIPEVAQLTGYTVRNIRYILSKAQKGA